MVFFPAPSLSKSANIEVVEALADEEKNRLLEFTSGRVGDLVEGDIVPVVLGKRRALREYSGDIPAHLAVGDLLYVLCGSGVVGEFRGVNEEWGVPMQVRVLGSVVAGGKQLNLKDAAIERKPRLESSAPIIGVVGTCMNIGKTTVICKLIKHFRRQDLKVAAVKLSGIASRYDPDKYSDAGASPVLSFMDGGLPSTCGDADEVVEVALGILHEVNTRQPDLIIAEFGDSILGEYHVEHLLRHSDIQRHICSFIVATADFVAMPYRILCDDAQREGAKLSPDLASGLFCYVPLHKIRYGIRNSKRSYEVFSQN